MQYGCLARYFNVYSNEVDFARRNGFDFVQLWYDNKGLMLKPVAEILPEIKRANFPAIVHAVLAVDEIVDHLPCLVGILRELGHKQIIIHPVCAKSLLVINPLEQLTDAIAVAVQTFAALDVTLFVENNSRLDPIFHDSEELEYLFAKNPAAKFLLDIAHIDDYEHLGKLVTVRKPEMLHIADRNLANIHEHLPLGQGNIDFERIFRTELADFDGKVVFEVIASDEAIIAAKDYFVKLIKR
jgi:sugar phosphate isomerase/epimerase